MPLGGEECRATRRTCSAPDLVTLLGRQQRRARRDVRRRRDRGRHDHAGRLVHDELQPGHDWAVGVGPDAGDLQHPGRQRIPFATTIPPVRRTDDPAARHRQRLPVPARPRRRGLSVRAGAAGPGLRAAARDRSSTCPPPRCSAWASASRRRRGGTGQPLPHGTFTPPRRSPRASYSTRTTSRPSESTIVDYNQAIAAAAAASGAILVDVNALFAETSRQRLRDRRHPSHQHVSYGRALLLRRRSPECDRLRRSSPTSSSRTLNAARATSIPQPNFSDILFTPNVPHVGGASVGRTAGPGTTRSTRGGASSLGVLAPPGARDAGPAARRGADARGARRRSPHGLPHRLPGAAPTRDPAWIRSPKPRGVAPGLFLWARFC